MERRWWLLFFAAAFISLSCSKSGTNNLVSPSSSARQGVKIGLSMKNAPSNVASIVGTLSRQGYDTLTSAFTISGDSATCLFSQIAVGTWHLQVDAYNSSSVKNYTGSTDVTVLASQTTQVFLTLNPTTGSINITVTWGGADTSNTDMALQFDGKSGEVVFPASNVLQLQSLTVECKVLFDSLNSYMPIMAQTNADLWNEADGYGIVFDHGHLVFRMAELPDLAFYAWTAYTPPLHQWIHLAFTYDRQYKCIYINGQLVLKAADSTEIYYGNDGMSLGTAFVSDQGGRLFFRGGIDELRIWNYARTQAQIDSTMDTTLTGHESGLVGYWNFNQNSSDTQVLDRTDNDNNGQLSGGVKFIPADSL